MLPRDGLLNAEVGRQMFPNMWPVHHGMRKLSLHNGHPTYVCVYIKIK
jgi:hypothetical protein